MGPLGASEILILLVVALLLFGPRKLPELGRMVGRGMAEFRKASNELRDTIEQEVKSYENVIAPPSAATPPTSPDTPTAPTAPVVASDDASPSGPKDKPLGPSGTAA